VTGSFAVADDERWRWSPPALHARVVGHGMNAAELARNPRLDTFFVRDLNAQPSGWAAADESYDAVVCCVR
jgi:hypothetical protein